MDNINNVIRCAKCDGEMSAPEATAYMNMESDRVTYTVKPKGAKSLPCHLHNDCKKALAKEPVVLMAAEVGQ